MKHKHHIIPKHMGGGDEISNIIELTPEEHAEAHLKLYEQYGKTEDLCAYYMLSGNMEKFRIEYGRLGGVAIQKLRAEAGLSYWGITWEEYNERKLEWSSKGGRIGGRRNAESGHIQKIQSEISREDHIKNSKKGAETCRTRGVNAFFDKNLRYEICQKGGRIGGRRNAESGHCKRIAIQYWKDVRSGKIQRIRRIWIYNSGTDHQMQIQFTEEIPIGYQKGRRKRKK